MDFIMHWLKKNNWLAILLLILLSFVAHAEGISISEKTGFRNERGEALISVIFQVSLPSSLKTALRQGVPLYFVLDYDLIDSTYTDYAFSAKSLFKWTNQIHYKLTYQPILNKYNLSMDGYATSYDNLTVALNAMGHLLNFNITDELGRKPVGQNQTITAKVRLALNVKDLPKPFQVNKLTSKDWILDSDWVDIIINKK